MLRELGWEARVAVPSDRWRRRRKSTSTDIGRVTPTAADTAALPHTDVLFFFNDEEARFVGAAVERLIPEDPQRAGALRVGVLYFIAGQLA